MRILVLSNAYPPHDYGGYELTCRDVMDRFRTAGHEVAVLTSTARVPGVVDDGDPTVRRTLIPYWSWEQSRSTVPKAPWSRLRIERHNIAELRRALDEVQPDVVSVWHMIAVSLSMLTVVERRRIPMVLTVANDWLIAAPILDGWTRMWQRWPLSWPSAVGGVPTSLPKLDDVVVNFVSDFMRQRTTALGRWRYPDAPIVCPGIDERDFPLDSPPDREWRWRVLYVGRIDPNKGLETLLSAFARLPSAATLTVLGRGNHDYGEKLRSLAGTLGVTDRVRFSQAPRSEIAAHYRAADVVVFPTEWPEPFGLVPLEAMACGTPVAASIRGGNAEYLNAGVNCLSFGERDADGLAAAVTAMAGDERLRRSLVRAGLETARQFTIEHYAEGLLPLHEQAAQTGGHLSRSG